MRFKVVQIGFAILFLLVISRFFYWQVIKGSELLKQANLQYGGSKELPALRGNILASDGSWLATTKTSWSISADLPNMDQDPNQVAEKLSLLIVKDADKTDGRDAFLIEKDRIYKLLTKDKLVWVNLKSGLDNDLKKEIENLNIKGLVFEPEEDRFYPESSASAHLVGFVGKNKEGQNVGYFGLEGYYDIALAGKAGFIQRQKDLSGAPLLSSGVVEVEAINGSDIKTNIVKSIQNSVYQKLKEGVEKYGAKEGSVIVMDPKSGSIYAMVSYPTFDPNEYQKADQSLFKNLAIADTFEPGSIFKVVVMASALDAGVIDKQTVCDICDKAIKIDKYTIENWNKEYRPNSSMVDIIVHSDNVGMSFIAQKMGSENMHNYLAKFGIGGLTNIDLQGEQYAKLRNLKDWKGVDLLTSSFGQGVAVTPIQMVRAVGAIANGGFLVEPKVMKSETVSRQIISGQAALDTTEMMVEAAKRGESKWTNLTGFSVAGKTGTAQIPIAGYYDAEKTIASFVGFAPSNNPKFVMLVTLKEPQSSTWASETAAPLWYAIARDLFNHFGIQPDSF